MEKTMNKKLEKELCLWYKLFPDPRCSITCQGFMEEGFRKRWGEEFLEFKKHAPKNKEERVKFVEEKK